MKKVDDLSPLEIKILLADDDRDDCDFFEQSLKELSIKAELHIVHDGEELMKLLAEKKEIFHVLFLDLNMPRKNGFTCLKEIKHNPKLNNLPVIILSTSYDARSINSVYEAGAQHYICKPSDFNQLKQLIDKTLALTIPGKDDPVVTTQPARKNFVINQSDPVLH